TTQATYTAQNIGAGKPERVITGAKHTVILSELISICILSVVFVFAAPIVNTFGLGTEAAGYCTAHIRCVALCLIPFASYYPILGLFQGANNSLYSTFVATSALAIRVISTYVLQEIPAISYRMV
ncbi:MAG: multi antimicrobial extrusion protein MatE, partial [Clostridiales bacterium]|nr:multi antimicrobial extrusion protein MatE [Clostridiales bacterium]